MTLLELSSVRNRLIFDLFDYFHESFLIALVEACLQGSPWCTHFDVSFKLIVFQLSLNVPLIPFCTPFLTLSFEKSLKCITVSVDNPSLSFPLVVLPLTLIYGAISKCIFSKTMFFAHYKRPFIKVTRWILDTSLAIYHAFFHFTHIRKSLSDDFSLSIKGALYKFSTIDITIFENELTLTIHLIVCEPPLIDSLWTITTESQYSFTIANAIFHLSFINTSITVLYFASAICTAFVKLSDNGQLAKSIDQFSFAAELAVFELSLIV